MIEIKSDTLTHNEIKALHKIICILHKTDYGLTIDTEEGVVVSRLTDM